MSNLASAGGSWRGAATVAGGDGGWRGGGGGRRGRGGGDGSGARGGGEGWRGRGGGDGSGARGGDGGRRGGGDGSGARGGVGGWRGRGGDGSGSRGGDGSAARGGGWRGGGDRSGARGGDGPGAKGEGGWRGGRGGGYNAGQYRGWRGRPWDRGGRGNFNTNVTQHRSGIAPAVSQARIIQSTLDIMCPYKGWRLYFSEGFVDSSPYVEKIKAFEQYFTSQIDLYDKDEIERKGSILVDYKDLLSNKLISQNLPDLAKKLKEMPEKILDCLGLAIHQVLTVDLERHAAELQGQEELPAGLRPIINIPHISARLYNFEPLTPLKSLRANLYGKFVAVRGTVVRVSNIKPLCSKLAFTCNSCGDTQSVMLPDGKYSTPTKCLEVECRGRLFTPNRSSPLTLTVDWQTIKVQELISDDQRESGRIPRTVECELTQDLVDSCVPGDMVTITGVIKVSSDDGSGRHKKDKCMFLLYIQANSVSNSKGQKSKASSETEGQGPSVEFSIKDLYAIQEIQAQDDLFKLIVNSLCPAIYGHVLVKAGLSLALFGGCQKYVDDKNRIPIRGDPHMLIVGDPGLGKSQLLQAVCNVAPRGVYVCGNTTTTSGLTVSLSRDGGSGDYALEAGALVLGDQGVCCIDEFDKMGSQHQALLEAMEQQSISLAKAGIVCTLPARTSIIAAANPAGGHYNKGKTVSENLKFDLVFILLDTPNEDHDHLLSEHVMAMRAGKTGAIGSAAVTRCGTQESNISILEVSKEKPLADRLNLLPGENLDLIPHQLLRKYLGYARHYVHPTLSAEAARILQNFYLELRKQNQTADSTPITTRQLESLIRLTEARARVELREKATQSDAEDVVEIMKHSLVDTYSDEFGRLDFDRSQLGSGMSNRSKAKKFITALNKLAERQRKNMFEIQELRQLAKDLQIQVVDFEGFVSALNEQGYLLKKAHRTYQLQTV